MSELGNRGLPVQQLQTQLDTEVAARTQAVHAPSWGGRILGAAMLATGLFVGGCTAGANTAPTPPSVTQQLDPAQEFSSLPMNACEDINAPHYDQACAAEQAHTRIAIVNFDFSEQEAQGITAEVGPAVTSATGSVFHAQAKLVNATPAARQRAKQLRGPADCVDGFVDFASVAAVETMPSLSLKNFDVVLALTDARSCQKNKAEGGAAEGVPGRYADIFGAIYPPDQRYSAQYMSSPAAHEIGHLLGLGHEGQLAFPTDQPGDYIEGTSQFMEPDATQDLKQLVGRARYLEYNSKDPTSVMGVYPGDPGKSGHNPPQLPLLQRPAIDQKGAIVGAPERRTIQPGQTITLDAAEAGRGEYVSFALATFPATITLQDTSAENDGPHSVDDIAIVPDVFNGAIADAKLELGTSDNSVADVGKIVGGSIYASGSRALTESLTVNSTTLAVTLDNGELTVRAH